MEQCNHYRVRKFTRAQRRPIYKKGLTLEEAKRYVRRYDVDGVKTYFDRKCFCEDKECVTDRA